MDFLRMISPNLVVDLKAGYTRVNIRTLNANYGTNVSAAFGVVNSNLPNFSFTTGLMPINLTGYASLGDSNNLPIIDVNNSFQYLGSVTYARGAHNLKMGVGLIRRQVNRYVNVNGLGLVTFSGSFSGNALGDLLAGHPLNVTRSNQIAGPWLSRMGDQRISPG
jgi:hypothetical protein